MACDSPFMAKPRTGTEMVPVPCGKCAPCKHRRVSQWVFRLMQEEKRSIAAHFVTLTYDTDHVPISKNGFMTLDKTDLQKFFKRLRKLCPHKLKYYAVGEYGTSTKRPHYHAIIFNVNDSECFAKAWSLDNSLIGSVHVGSVTQSSIAYTMKYIDKSKFRRGHQRDDRSPEFPIMSKNLGSNYLTDQIQEYHVKNLDRNYVTQLGGHKVAMPKYYRDIILNDDLREKQRQLISFEIDRIKVDEYLAYQNVPKVKGWDYQKFKDHERQARDNKFKYSQQIKKRDV